MSWTWRTAPKIADWFVGGKCNIVRNCVDRHAAGPLANKPALIAEMEDGSTREFSYAELAAQVNAMAAALTELGVSTASIRAACYMPMVAEVVFAMLATQKIGAVFIPIFSGYAAPAVRERLQDAEVKVVFTADVSFRRGQWVALKSQLDTAIDGLSCVTATLVMRRDPDAACPMQQGRDHFLSEYSKSATSVPTRPMPAMAPALMLFTSGTTGKPKATVHSHAGCLAQMGKELCYNFDLKANDVFFWFTDIGWMMGPWEVIGVFMHGATLVILKVRLTTPRLSDCGRPLSDTGSLRWASVQPQYGC